MSGAGSVTLQINLAPTDLPHAVHVLPHQLRQWSGQVQEIVFTFDLHRTSHGGRFSEGWEERRAPMEELLDRALSRTRPRPSGDRRLRARDDARRRGEPHGPLRDSDQGHRGEARSTRTSTASIRRATTSCSISTRTSCSGDWPRHGCRRPARCLRTIQTCSHATRSRGRPPPTRRCERNRRPASRTARWRSASRS